MAVLALARFGCADAAALDFGGSLVATTDYVYRGLTQSGRKAALQADGHLQTTDGWFAGVWGSFATSAAGMQSRSEINLYGGHTWVLSPDVTLSAHYARYLYPDNRHWVKYYYDDYNEFQMAMSYQDRVSVSVAYSPRVVRYGYGPVRRHGSQLAYEASFRQPLWRRLNLTAGVGHYDLSDVFDRSYWAFSGGLELNLDRVSLMLNRFEVEYAAEDLFGRQSADGTWALTAAWRF